jgi:hypothetical protein
MKVSEINFIKKIRESVLSSLSDNFTEDEKDSIKCLIRIVVIQNFFLQKISVAKWSEYYEFKINFRTNSGLYDLSYQAETVFSGISSFMRINQLFQIIDHTSNVDYLVKFDNFDLFKTRFNELTILLENTNNYASNIELLLLLFKMSLVFSSMTYI